MGGKVKGRGAQRRRGKEGRRAEVGGEGKGRGSAEEWGGDRRRKERSLCPNGLFTVN